MANGWDLLLGEIINKYNIKDGSVKTNVCKEAIIYSKEGVCYASHPPTFKLKDYKYDMPQEDGSTKPVEISEFKCALAASRGDRSGGGPGGIRFDNTKFMFMAPGTVPNSGFLSRQGGGGATVVATDKLLIMGIWDKDEKTGDGKF